jgi:transcriptional regulator with XRE-family HTH domain
MNKHIKKLLTELKNREYRDAYVSSSVDVGIAFQVRELRKQVPWTQAELAEKANMKQERISAIENPSNSPSITTLKKLANAFDVGLIVRFVPFSELVNWETNLSTGSLNVLSYDQESFFQDIKIGQGSSTDSAITVMLQEDERVSGAYNYRVDMVSNVKDTVRVFLNNI